MAGMSEAAYRERMASGDKWCYACKDWHGRDAFASDVSRGDGLSPICKKTANARCRRLYVRRTRPAPGRRFVPIRDGDKRQAERRVNHLVDVGLLPSPGALACCDCGHRSRERRHEYDHYLGYAAEHHEHVQAVCSRCHRRRAIVRGEWRSKNPARLGGEQSPAHKLLESDVQSIRAAAESGETYRSIAKRFRIHYNHVGRIVRKERWS